MNVEGTSKNSKMPLTLDSDTKVLEKTARKKRCQIKERKEEKFHLLYPPAATSRSKRQLTDS